MSTDKWAEITGSTEGLKQQLAKIATRIFGDDYINSHPSWREEILADRKGYVRLDLLAQQVPVRDCLGDWSVADRNTQQLALYYSLRQYCPELIVNSNRVRRVTLYRWNKLVKPLLLDRIDQPISLTDVRQYLGSDAFSEHEVFVPQSEQYQFVYAPSHRAALKQLRSEFLPFKVVDFFGLCKERERESRFWEQYEVRKYSRLQYEPTDRRRNGWNAAEEMAERPRRRARNNDMQEEHYDHRQSEFQSILLMPNPKFNSLLFLPQQSSTQMSLQ